MAAESAGDRQQQWVLVVRRAFGIPDPASNEDARRAHRFVDREFRRVDPEHLAFAATSEYPPEVVAAAQQVLERVSQYVREPPFASEAELSATPSSRRGADGDSRISG